MRIHILIVVAAVFAGGCVTTKTFDKKVAELNAERDAHDQASADRERALKAQLDDANQHLASARAERDKLQKQLDDTQALVMDLKQRLEKLGQNVDKLAHEKGQLDATLADAKARLEELRKQKQAAEQRAQTFRNLVAQLRSMIDAGQLKVVIRDGRMIIALPNDVLFDSGKTAIKPDGQAALTQVAQVLAAAGYGEFDPVVPNDSPEHRAQNRRIEIVLQPNLSDLPPLDDITAKPVAGR